MRHPNRVYKTVQPVQADSSSYQIRNTGPFAWKIQGWDFDVNNMPFVHAPNAQARAVNPHSPSRIYSMQNVTHPMVYQTNSSVMPTVSQHLESYDHVYLVDDDPIQREFIQRLCESSGLKTTCFSTPTEFLLEAANLTPGCLLLDMMMPGMDGLALFEHIADQKLPLTCVLMTGFADTTSCRAAFRAGMFDFVDKDRPPMEILDTIKLAIVQNRNSKKDADASDVSAYEWDVLTIRESEIANLLMEGNTLKQIASMLGISVQTASKHRSRVFEKTNVSSEVELLKVTMARNAAA